MSATLCLEDFQEVRQAEMTKLLQLAGSIGESEQGREKFAAQERAIEGLVRTTYQCAAVMARKSGSMEETTDVWRDLVAFCDSILARLRELDASHPSRPGKPLYDLTLDCRNAAARRMELHS